MLNPLTIITQKQQKVKLIVNDKKEREKRKYEIDTRVPKTVHVCLDDFVVFDDLTVWVNLSDLELYPEKERTIELRRRGRRNRYDFKRMVDKQELYTTKFINSLYKNMLPSSEKEYMKKYNEICYMFKMF